MVGTDVETCTQVQVLEEDSTGETKRLKSILDDVLYIKSKYDPVQVLKDIKTLQDSSRIQNYPRGLREELLRELQKRKIIKAILDQEPLL